MDGWWSAGGQDDNQEKDYIFITISAGVRGAEGGGHGQWTMERELMGDTNCHMWWWPNNDDLKR